MAIRLIFLMIAGFASQAQTSLPPGIVRGRLLTLRDQTLQDPASRKRVGRTSGEYTLEVASGDIYACTYDVRTLFENSKTIVAPADLRPGDPVEIVTDRRGDACYTRVLRVTQTAPASVHVRPVHGRLANIRPRGQFLVSGLVVRDELGTLRIRTREGDKTVLVTPETLYSSDGVKLGSAASTLNKHVFVRAGRNLRGELEAYHVMWAETLLIR